MYIGPIQTKSGNLRWINKYHIKDIIYYKNSDKTTIFQDNCAPITLKGNCVADIINERCESGEPIFFEMPSEGK